MKKIDNTKSYTEYENMQRNRSRKKWGSLSFDMVQFHKLLDECMPEISGAHDIACMGVRGGNYNEGNEMAEFRHRPEFHPAHVYGVDISPLVLDVIGKTFCKDFSMLPVEWENGFDLVYSNSLDHSRDVFATLKEWWRVLKPKGFLLLSLSTNPAIGDVDIYQFETSDVPAMLMGGKFELVKNLETKTADDFSVLLRCKK